ncbi:YdeI/OmpD-associated family protein [Halogranum rubrum]|uniref:Bacteriocin-protection protein, YdeI/OmpD-associated family n=1 Tax=Halogranum salarium B-1 TaxID=1210908 RepID=J3JGI9_9EURY|nr:YdeI/OmpD-associated family protein [Halogranum salarium]EJN60146.1 hypothetical protein HSB1_07490 [Halogranum salarium B-1]
MEPQFFDSREEFRNWLEEYHDTADELWVGYYKVDAERSGISYGESVEEALCYGWIDGLVNRIDDERYMRRFTPRKPDSKWSKQNTKRAKSMVEAGRMTSAGIDSIEAAKESGEWQNAYRVGDDHAISPELKRALLQNETAWANFQQFSNSSQYGYIAWIDDAKTTATRKSRIEQTVELAVQGVSPYDENGKRRI